MNILTFLKAVTFKVKTSVVAFWATFGVFGLLLFQHLVTLAAPSLKMQSKQNHFDKDRQNRNDTWDHLHL